MKNLKKVINHIFEYIVECKFFLIIILYSSFIYPQYINDLINNSSIPVDADGDGIYDCVNIFNESTFSNFNRSSTSFQFVKICEFDTSSGLYETTIDDMDNDGFKDIIYPYY